MLSTKDRILSAATDLLDAGGPSAVTLRAVGEAAGISQSAPYRHFADKRALMDAMVRQIIQQMRAAIDAAKSEAGSPFVALNLGVSQYFDFARRFPVRYRLLLEESRSDTAVGKEAREAFAAVADLVHAAESRGELRGGDSNSRRGARARRGARDRGSRTVRPRQLRLRSRGDRVVAWPPCGASVSRRRSGRSLGAPLLPAGRATCRRQLASARSPGRFSSFCRTGAMA